MVYESKHRVIKFLEEIKVLNDRYSKLRKDMTDQGESKKEINKFPAPVTSVVVCREISKMHETVYRGEMDDILDRIKENRDDQKGEFTIILGK
mgnify:CR=1 FL=1